MQNQFRMKNKYLDNFFIMSYLHFLNNQPKKYKNDPLSMFWFTTDVVIPFSFISYTSILINIFDYQFLSPNVLQPMQVYERILWLVLHYLPCFLFNIYFFSYYSDKRVKILIESPS